MRHRPPISRPPSRPSFRYDESGATAIEYAVIVTLVVLGIVAGSQFAGSGLNKMFAVIGNKVESAAETAGQNSSN